MSKIHDIIFNTWQSRPNIRTTPSGWICSNAVCCIHNGETPDTKGRGGIISDGEAISYHCFNCGFKVSWRPGWSFSYNIQQLMHWMGVDDKTIGEMILEAIRLKNESDYVYEKPTFTIDMQKFDLPKNAELIHEHINNTESVPQDLYEVIEYAYSRGLTEEQILNMYWTPEKRPAKLYRRLIIPLMWNKKIVGYTARTIDGIKFLKYYSSHDHGYVYNIDNQYQQNKFAILVEGPFDALVVNGISPLRNTINEIQARIINNLHKEIIVVPDKGKSGKKLIEHALEYGWSVSFPEWEDESVKDINDAVRRYGKIFCIKHILKHKYKTSLEIKLMERKY